MNKIDFSLEMDRLNAIFAINSNSDRQARTTDSYYEIFGETPKDRLHDAITILIETHDRNQFPLPANFYAALNQTYRTGSNSSDFVRIENGCEKCEGSGFISAIKNDADYCFRCTCTAGGMRSKEIPEWNEKHRDKGYKLKWE